MKQIILLLLLSLVVACGGSKDTPDPSDQDGDPNAQEGTEEEVLYTITFKEDEEVADFTHKATFVTQGNKFEFDVTSNDFCVVLKKSQFETLSIKVTLDKAGWSYISLSDFSCDNNAPEKEKKGPASMGGRGGTSAEDDCKIPINNLFLEVNSTWWGYEYELVKAEKRNPNMGNCNKLY